MTDDLSSQLKATLKNHPKALRLLFAATVLLSQAVPVVVANGGDATNGP